MSAKTMRAVPATQPWRGRLAAGMLLIGTLLAQFGCNRLPTNPHPGSTLPFQADMDESPAWSPDGRTVAYHRRFASSDGPPGLYVIPASGGSPRFLLQGDFWGPENITFSPDSRYLAAALGFQIVIVDTQTGEVRYPFYATNGAGYPTWSPDGSSIAYTRFGSFVSPDSEGIHVFSFGPGTDVVIRHGGVTVYGTQLIWDPDDDVILGTTITADGLNLIIEAVAPSGASVRELYRSHSNGDLQFVGPYRTPETRQFGAVYLDTESGWYFVGIRTGGAQSLPFPQPPYAYSPDGSWQVTGLWDPESAAYVLFVRRVDDVLGATYRRLTRWAPP